MIRIGNEVSACAEMGTKTEGMDALVDEEDGGDYEEGKGDEYVRREALAWGRALLA